MKLPKDRRFKVQRLGNAAVALLCASVGLAQTTGGYIPSLKAGGGTDTSATAVATKAALAGVLSSAYDAAGNLYTVETPAFNSPRLRKVGLDGNIKTLSSATFFPLPASRLSPQSSAPLWTIAVLQDGSVVIAADSRRDVVPVNGAYQILQLASDGTLGVRAGTGKAGFSGDGGPATVAQFSDISALAADGAGNLYIADDGNFRIRKISANGTVTTIAGTGVSGTAGDGGPGTAAQISKVAGLAVVAGNVYFSQPTSYKVRRIRPDGVVETVAGNGNTGTPVEGSDARLTTLANPTLVGGLPDGRVLFADDPTSSFRAPIQLRTVDSLGKVRTVSAVEWASDGTSTPSGCARTVMPWDQYSALSVHGMAISTSGEVAIAGDSSAAGVIISLKPTPIVVRAAGTLNAANYGTLLSPGVVFVMYGSNLGPASLVSSAFDKNGVLPTTLAGSQVFFDGIAAPLLYVSGEAIAGFMPFGAAASSPCAVVQVKQGDTVSLPVSKLVFSASPALFTANASGTGPAVAANQDGSLNTAGNPIGRGSVIVLYATGGGRLTPVPQDGSQVVPPTLPKPLGNVVVTIDGKPAEVLYAGSAPFLVAGVMQINARVPIDSATGPTIPLVLTVDGIGSDSLLLSGNVTIAVK